MFESNYARIEYIEKDNVVLHIWKKEAHYEMYRASVIASLHLFCLKYPISRAKLICGQQK